MIDIVIEAYAGHHVIGTQPFETNPVPSYRYTFESIDICTKNQDIADFIYDLRCLNQLAEVMDEKSFRRADVINCLAKVHETVYYSPEHTDEAVWRPALARAREIMRPCLEAKNAESAPKVGLVGHSHMDTAWLWDIPKTIKKCARTYANQLALMEEYPEYRFIQSSAFHLELIRRHYPELFDRIKEKSQRDATSRTAAYGSSATATSPPANRWYVSSSGDSAIHRSISAIARTASGCRTPSATARQTRRL